MSKDRFTRGRVHDKHMRTIIIRLDFIGVEDSDKLVALFNKAFRSEFRSEEQHKNGEINISFRKEDIETIRKTLSLPVGVVEKETYTRYQGMKNVSCDVVLDLSKFYLCMTITCNNNYDGLDRYLNCFKGATKIFKNKVDGFCPRRLGLRKVRVEVKPSLQDFSNTYEDFLYRIPDYGVGGVSVKKTEYVDVIELEDKLKFNVHSGFISVRGRDGSLGVMSSLDIDAYYDGIDLSKADVNKLINNANIREFEVYKSCMKEVYLESIFA